MPPENRRNTRGIRLADSSQPAPKTGMTWFFGIGIDAYAHFSPLNNAVKDVQDLQQLLQQQYGLKTEYTFTLFNETATRDNIIDQLDKLVENVGPADKLLIYFSGHGYVHPRSQLAYWIPQDAARGRISGYLPNSTVRDYLKAIESMHTLLISDSCFSGSLFVRGAHRSDTALDELEQRRSRWGLVSGRHDEQVYDGEPGTNSPFAASVLKVLRNNRRAKLNVARLADQVVEMTRSNYMQLPEGNPLFGVGHDGGQYVFRMVSSESAFWERCLAENSLAAYNGYLDQFPQGEYADQALHRIRDLEEDREWEKTTQLDRIHSYRTFLRIYPNGQYADAARDRIRVLQSQVSREEDLVAGPIVEPVDNTAVRQAVALPLQGPDQQERTGNTLSGTLKRYLPYIGGVMILLLAIWLAPKILSPSAPYELLPYEDTQQGKYGYRTAAGETIIPPRFNYAYPFREGRAVVEGDKGLGVIDRAGRLVVDFQYDAIEAFSQGRALVILQGKHGFIDTSGQVIIPIEFDNAGSFDKNGEAYAEIGGHGMTIDRDGNCIRNCPDGSAAAPTYESANRIDWDQNTWEEIQHSDDVGNFQRYITTFPNGKYREQAIARIRTLNEEEDWRRVQNENTIRAYLRYYNKFPQGKYAAEAQIRIRELGGTVPSMGYPLRRSYQMGDREYNTVRFAPEGPTWLAENVTYDVPERSWCYNNDAALCRQYGRLYTLTAARRACDAVGGRLPTEADWRRLIERFGDDVSDTAFSALVDRDRSGFDATLAGYRNLKGDFLDLNHAGLYWLEGASSQPQAAHAWLLSGSEKRFHLVSMDPREGLSCRCIRYDNE